MDAAYEVETLKLRRSRVPRAAGLALILGPAGMAAAFSALAARDGADPMSVKAQAMTTGVGWDGFLAGLSQILASGGLLGMGVVVAWCFGREYVDRTVVSLYGSATPRTRVAAAKLLVLTIWCAEVSLLMVPATLAVGMITGLGWPDAAAFQGMARIALLSFLTGLLSLTMALFASVGRGYLPAIGGLIGIIVVAQVAVVAGVGSWVPYSAPGLWAVSAMTLAMPAVPLWHLALVPIAACLIGLATVEWWRRAELA